MHAPCYILGASIMCDWHKPCAFLIIYYYYSVILVILSMSMQVVRKINMPNLILDGE